MGPVTPVGDLVFRAPKTRLLTSDSAGVKSDGH